jgi:hypothetical protein
VADPVAWAAPAGRDRWRVRQTVTREGEHLGEVGDDVLAGGGHPRQFALLPGRRLGLFRGRQVAVIVSGMFR